MPEQSRAARRIEAGERIKIKKTRSEYCGCHRGATSRPRRVYEIQVGGAQSIGFTLCDIGLSVLRAKTSPGALRALLEPQDRPVARPE